MKRIESIWAELSAKSQEVELSEEQKVELSSIAEIKQVQGKMNNLNGSSNNSLGRAQKNIEAVARAKEDIRDSIRDMEQDIADAYKFMKDGKAALSSFKKMAKELGLDATSSKEYKELEITVTNDMVDVLNDSKETLKELKSYAK
jgi:predicted  nucleic acid-binding Zn-ribbon protein